MSGRAPGETSRSRKEAGAAQPAPVNAAGRAFRTRFGRAPQGGRLRSRAGEPHRGARGLLRTTRPSAALSHGVALAFAARQDDRVRCRTTAPGFDGSRLRPRGNAGARGVRTVSGRRGGRPRCGLLDAGVPRRVRRGDRLRPSRGRRSFVFVGGGDRGCARAARGSGPDGPRRRPAGRNGDAACPRSRRRGTRSGHPGGRDGPVHLPGRQARGTRSTSLSSRAAGRPSRWTRHGFVSWSPTAASAPTREPPPGASSRRTCPADAGGVGPRPKVPSGRRWVSDAPREPHASGTPRGRGAAAGTAGRTVPTRRDRSPPHPRSCRVSPEGATPPRSARRLTHPTRACGATTR